MIESSLTTALGDAGADGLTDRGSTPRTSTTKTRAGTIWQAAYQVYADHASYREMVQSRRIRLFALEIAGI